LRPLVLDGSAIIGVLLRDEHSAYTDKVMVEMEKRPSLYVPSHWWVETANGLLMAERRRRVTSEEVMGALLFLQRLALTTDEQTNFHSAEGTVTLARQYSLTIYDAAYLELAIRRGSALATTDRALARAAKAAGVELLA
jgi:predicted nucleic acid-binding protein